MTPMIARVAAPLLLLTLSACVSPDPIPARRAPRRMPQASGPAARGPSARVPAARIPAAPVDAPPRRAARDSLTAVVPHMAALAPIGRIGDARIDESSGLAKAGGWWWTINDSGGAAAVFRGSTPTFDDAVEIPVPGAVNVDWEELTVLDGDLIVCDVGDNGRERDDLMLYRLRVEADGSLSPVATYPVAYEDGPHDVEGVFVLDGHIHLIVKNRGEPETQVLRIGFLVHPTPPGVSHMAEVVGVLDLPEGEQVTAADAHPSGTVAILTYSQLMIYPADRLSGTPLREWVLHARQCESVAWDGDDIVFNNEQRDVYRVDDVLTRREIWWLPEREGLTLKVVPRTRMAVQASMPPMELLADLPMKNTGPREFLRLALSDGQLFFDGQFVVDGEFVPTATRGDRLGTAIVVAFSDAHRLRISEYDPQFAVVGSDKGTVRARRIDLSGGGGEAAGLAGVSYSGRASKAMFAFHLILDVETVFPAGLPDEFLMNVVGLGIREGLDQPYLSGLDLFSIYRPYVWAGVSVTR